MNTMKLMTGSVLNREDPSEVLGFTKEEVGRINYFIKDMLANEYSNLKQFSFEDEQNKKTVSEDLKNNLYVVAMNPISFKSDKVTKVDATKFAKDLESRIEKSNVSDAKVQSIPRGDNLCIRIMYKKMKKFIRKQEFAETVKDAKDTIKEKFNKTK